ncbi:hypothetical protein NPIL_497861 [Nephila pilipes]|uniref:Uncharacterized protein n=1 Tax=Nephila pilipes TaxID=299642 RepID=A0A8X6PYF4_NEPPI|nr:hypothetical protein NPIL_497861 [Nephila pilipes]
MPLLCCAWRYILTFRQGIHQGVSVIAFCRYHPTDAVPDIFHSASQPPACALDRCYLCLLIGDVLMFSCHPSCSSHLAVIAFSEGCLPKSICYRLVIEEDGKIFSGIAFLLR